MCFRNILYILVLNCVLVCCIIPVLQEGILRQVQVKWHACTVLWGTLKQSSKYIWFGVLCYNCSYFLKEVTLLQLLEL